MKKIVFINSVIGTGSTGRICIDLANEYKNKGYDVKIAFGRGKCDDEYKKYAVRIGNIFDILWHVLMTRLFDLHGLCSKHATKKFLKWLEGYDPDELWLHNMHGYYINYEILFKWIKEHPKLKIKWTLHDCWAFTGHCAHYTFNKCYKWKCACECCKYHFDYPGCIVFENSKNNFNTKKRSFIGVNNLTIVTPSNWLKNEIEKSFLNSYDIVVIYNKINRQIFKPVKSNILEKLNINDKHVILSVASIWNEKKGLCDLLKLSSLLNKNFILVIVGLSKKQIKTIKNQNNSNSLLLLPKISDQNEMAKLYTASDLYINASYEESYGMTNAEAALCGTKVISYNCTALKESIDLNNGVAIEPGVSNLYHAIMNCFFE